MFRKRLISPPGRTTLNRSNTMKLEVTPDYFDSSSCMSDPIGTIHEPVVTVEPREIAPKAADSSNMSSLSAERAFGLYVGAELENMAEPKRTEMKSKIMALLLN